MNLDRLWYALWVPMAFAGTILVLKWIVWGFDLVTVILFGLVVLFFLARIVIWQRSQDPY
jgi:hypothetical protein